MPPKLLCDSDVILKLCVYRMEVWRDGRMLAGHRLATLAASRFIIPKRISQARTNGPKDAVLSSWSSFEVAAEFLEPSEAEIETAAELEALAQRNGRALDSGESLLVSILVTRGLGQLVTGDKRAIIALGQLCAVHGQAAKAARRVACLEQLMADILAHEGGAVVRAGVCAEPDADKALSICFRCASSPADTDGAYLEGLTSYIQSLRAQSGEVIRAGNLVDAGGAGSAASTKKDGIGFR